MKLVFLRQKCSDSSSVFAATRQNAEPLAERLERVFESCLDIEVVRQLAAYVAASVEVQSP